MAIIDDLKQKTEAGLKTLKETAQDIAFNVEKHAIIGKKKYLDITKLQRNIQKMNGGQDGRHNKDASLHKRYRSRDRHHSENTAGEV
jgi:hypothetical protein